MPLYLVATPIGNADDITLRALDTLRSADIVACEDTRKTGRFLSRHGVRAKKLVSYHEHNERVKAPRLLAELLAGRSVALVSNSGTPLLSDPGFVLVRDAIAAGVKVVPVPGASAVTAAIAAAGLPVHRISFLGFPPRGKQAMRTLLQSLAQREDTLVFLEAPARVGKLLGCALEVFGDRRACVAREMTKVYEEFVRGTLAELADRFLRESARGECTVLIEGATRARR